MRKMVGYQQKEKFITNASLWPGNMGDLIVGRKRGKSDRILRKAWMGGNWLSGKKTRMGEDREICEGGKKKNNRKGRGGGGELLTPRNRIRGFFLKKEKLSKNRPYS